MNKLRPWRMAIIYAMFFSVNALCAAVINALTGADWSKLTTQARFVIALAILGSWTNTMMAFMSKKAQKLDEDDLTQTPQIQLPIKNQ